MNITLNYDEVLTALRGHVKALGLEVDDIQDITIAAKRGGQVEAHIQLGGVVTSDLTESSSVEEGDASAQTDLFD